MSDDSKDFVSNYKKTPKRMKKQKVKSQKEKRIDQIKILSILNSGNGWVSQ